MHSTSSAGGLLLGLLTRSSEEEKARPEDEEDPPTFGDDCAFPLRCECVVAGRCECVVAGRVPLSCPPRAGQVADSGGRLIDVSSARRPSAPPTGNNPDIVWLIDIVWGVGALAREERYRFLLPAAVRKLSRVICRKAYTPRPNLITKTTTVRTTQGHGPSGCRLTVA